MGAGEEDHSTQLFMLQMISHPDVLRKPGRAGVWAPSIPGCMQGHACFREWQGGTWLLWGRAARETSRVNSLHSPSLLCIHVTISAGFCAGANLNSIFLGSLAFLGSQVSLPLGALTSLYSFPTTPPHASAWKLMVLQGTSGSLAETQA